MQTGICIEHDETSHTPSPSLSTSPILPGYHARGNSWQFLAANAPSSKHFKFVLALPFMPFKCFQAWQRLVVQTSHRKLDGAYHTQALQPCSLQASCKLYSPPLKVMTTMRAAMLAAWLLSPATQSRRRIP